MYKPETSFYDYSLKMSSVLKQGTDFLLKNIWTYKKYSGIFLILVSMLVASVASAAQEREVLNRIWKRIANYGGAKNVDYTTYDTGMIYHYNYSS